jgi:3-methyl-2-oxobutanoate hydroxymethyltransferase
MKKKIKINNKQKIICLTAYSRNMAEVIDKHCDIILVGDSLANVIYAMENTHKISLDTMIMHATSVRKGTKKALLVVDMPKGSYNNLKIAKKNAKMVFNKTKCDAIKIESNGKNYKIINGLVKCGYNVMGHIGFTPQYFNKFEIKGTNDKEIKDLINDAIRIEEAGAFSVVLECIKTNVSKIITKKLKIPTIGIGSSKFCDGQVLVTEDLIGLSGFHPRFVKKYIDMKSIIDKGIKKFKSDVKKGIFPEKNNSY